MEFTHQIVGKETEGQRRQGKGHREKEAVAVEADAVSIARRESSDKAITEED